MGKSKYGRGLGREVIAAVNSGELREPFDTRDLWALIARRGWDAPANSVNVFLHNSSNDYATNGKYFVHVGRGKFKLRPEYRKPGR
jgi:hypothetical protein